MVNEQELELSLNYNEKYDQYWTLFDNNKEHVSNYSHLAEQIVYTCGLGKLLDIGSGQGYLVKELLKRGINAYGLDVSNIIIDRCNQSMPQRFTQGSVIDLPFKDESFTTIISTLCLEHLNSQHVVQALSEIYRVAKKFVFFKIATTNDSHDCGQMIVEKRAWWERKCFEAGFRKHHAYYKVNSYESIHNDDSEIYVLLEKISNKSMITHPFSDLLKERDLHMDMMRESGSRSDAHVYRYQFASQYIRPGDIVLDAACGLGYGTHVLKSLSLGAKFKGIDGSDYAISYATANYADNDSIEFMEGFLPDCLADYPDASIDVIVSFETLEHVKDPVSLLNEFKRLLTPGGRLVTSVPNDWSDETGNDPNPYHYHVYDMTKLHQELHPLFEIEEIYGQTADQVKLINKKCEWEIRPRSFKKINQNDILNFESEWLIAVVTKPPLNTQDINYIEKLFTLDELEASGNALAFARDYENPWIVKSLISIGFRTENEKLRISWAKKILNSSLITSADQGASLCVLAYSGISNPSLMKEINLLVQIDEYISTNIHLDKLNPTVLRWIISLLFVRSLLYLSMGEREKSKADLDLLIKMPFMSYSPTLLTKLAEAAYIRGLLSVADNKNKEAKETWTHVFNQLNHYLAQHLSLGYKKIPPAFELRELSIVIGLMGRLCSAIKDQKYVPSSPTLFGNALKADLPAALQQLVEIQKAKNWLESEWNNSKKQLEETQKVKDWLESEWTNSKIQLAETQKVKDWLESEWTNSKIQLAETQKAKDWLESEWTNSKIQLAETQKAKNFVETEFHNAKLQLVEAHNTKMWLENESNNHKEQLSLLLASNWYKLGLHLKKGNLLRVMYYSGACFIPARLKPLFRPIKHKLIAWKYKKNEAKWQKNVLSQVTTSSLPKPLIIHIIPNFMLGGSSRLVADLVENIGTHYQHKVITLCNPEVSPYPNVDVNVLHPESPEQVIRVLQPYNPSLIHIYYWGDCDSWWYDIFFRALEQLNIPVIQNINTPIHPYEADFVKRYIYVSNYVQQQFGNNNSDNQTIYPGSDFSLFNKKETVSLTKNCIGMVYRLECDKLNEKSIDVFIKVVQKRPQTKALIVGGGSYLDLYKKKTQDTGVDVNFEFTGYIEYSSLPEIYARMNVFVAPVWKESFGQVSPFAMNMEIPVVGYNVGGIAEIVNNPSLLATPGNADELAEIIIALLDEPERCKEIGYQNKLRAQKLFSLESMISSYKEVYSNLIGGEK